MKIKIKNLVFNYRFANEKDVDIINKFDLNIYRTVDKRFYYRHNKKTLKKILKKGKLLLVFDKDKLIAWSAILLEITDKLSKFDLSDKQKDNCGLFISAVVSKKYRGFGIQNFMIKKRIEYLRKINRKYGIVAVDLNNKYSIRNILLAGFKFVRKIEDYSKNQTLNYYVLKV